MRHNIFCNTGSRSGGSSFGAIYIHGGCETRAEQNVFINCQSAFGSQTWTDEHYARKLAGEAEWRKNHVDVETGVYPKAYPKLAQILDPTLPRVNYAFDNKIFNSSMAMNGLLKLYGNSYIKPASESDADAIRKNPNLSIGDVRKYFGSDPLVKHILGRKIGLVKDPFSGEIVIIECTEARKEGKSPSRYMTTRNFRKTQEKVEKMKYNPSLKRRTLHREIKK